MIKDKATGTIFKWTNERFMSRDSIHDQFVYTYVNSRWLKFVIRQFSIRLANLRQ